MRGKNSDSFCTCDNFPSSLLPALVKDGICTNSQSILVSGRDVCFRAEREITGVRGCGPLRGRRQTKHLGQVDLDIWTLQGNLSSGQHSVSSQR